MSSHCIVISTFENHEQAKKVWEQILTEKLAACIQELDINSHYVWRGDVCHDSEIMLLFKTTWELYDSLELRIKELHPYETPEIIAIDIEKGFKGYLKWIEDVTKH